MFTVGFFAGLGAAFFQDCGYVFSRLFVKRGGGAGELLIATQLWMGAGGLLLLPFVLVRGGTSLSGELFLPLFFSAYGSLGGQLFFFRAGREIEPARLSSMMGLRVVLVALALYFLRGERCGTAQIAGIVLAAVSAFVLNWKDGGFELRGMGGMGASLLCYTASDLSVMDLVRLLAGTHGLLHGALLAVCLVNLLLAFSVLPWAAARLNQSSLRRSGAFSGTWLAKQLLLYVCYGTAGPVFGNVVMSLRGPIALGLTRFLAARGVNAVSDYVDAKTRLRRLFATGMMAAAIILYAV